MNVNLLGISIGNTRTRLGVWKERLVKDPTRLMEAYLASTQALGFNAAVMA